MNNQNIGNTFSINRNMNFFGANLEHPNNGNLGDEDDDNDEDAVTAMLI